MYLEKINKANDIKEIPESELKGLCKEIRKFLVKSVSKTGGHLASNLGAVELTCALHYVLDFPEDKLVFDVGHQAYVHKILTGRKESFGSLRQTGGLSGFPNPGEDETDLFKGGHASTAIGEGVGLAFAKHIKGGDENIVVVVGDGALTGGLAFEGLNNAAMLKGKENLTIILNDNNMSIGKNVGGVSTNIAALRTSKVYSGLKENVLNTLEKVPKVGDRIAHSIRTTKDGLKRLIISNMFFEDMDIMYLGPVDGHDIHALITIIREALSFKGPVVIHAVTKKGKGYKPAMENPSKYHGIAPFDIKTGKETGTLKESYTDVLSEAMVDLAEKDKSLCAVTAAMADGSGVLSFGKKFPKRFFDVGIAEEHGVVLAAALAKAGLTPIVSIYSTFLQRAYDQILMEVCLNDLPVVFAVGRAGIVGADGATHQGVFDIVYLTMMPKMTVMAPKNKKELVRMLDFAASLKAPCAIRYPKGNSYEGLGEFDAPLELGKFEPLFDGRDCIIIALGYMVKVGAKVREILQKEGITCGLVNARFAKPLDREFLSSLKRGLIVSLEEGTLTGGFGMQVESALMEGGFKGRFIKIGVPDDFVPQGDTKDVHKSLGLDPKSIANKILEALK